MDKLQAERERGISIDTKLRRLESRHYFANIIDTPGHKDYVHNMITGSSQVCSLVQNRVRCFDYKLINPTVVSCQIQNHAL